MLSGFEVADEEFPSLRPSRLSGFLKGIHHLGKGLNLGCSIGSSLTKLEDTYAALTIAQQTLADAATALQRRFAPRITRRAQSLLSRMTAGRYHSLTMRDDFSLQAGAEGEDPFSCLNFLYDQAVAG